MKRKGLIFSTVFLFLLHSLIAQNINGFQIFVSKKQFTSIAFHSDIQNLAFVQKNSPYKVIFMGTKTIFLETSEDVKPIYDLLITEGGRNHKFAIIYGQEVDQSQRDNDYSNLNQLKTLIKNFSPVAAGSSKQADVAKENVVPEDSNRSQKDDPRSPDDQANINFYILIDGADKARKSGQLQIAKTKYEQALKIQPDNIYAQTQLQVVNDAAKDETETKYNAAIAKAKQASVSNNYNEAITYISVALEIRPGDPYATNQLAELQRKAETASIEKANLQKDSLFESYLRAGDKALSDKSYDAAAIAYTEALKIKPDNSKAVLKLKAVGQQKIKDSVEAARQRTEALVASFLNAGDKAFNEKQYESARFSYIEAQKIKPGDEQIKSKLNSVNQILYAGFLNAGNEALNRNSYDEAKDAYNEALKIKPGDATALAKLQALNKQKEQDEAEEKFRNYVITGDKALAEKSYQIATIAYTEALRIKPNDAVIKTRLNSISQMIISDSLESKRKQTEDLYQGFIASGNKALNEKLYNEAKVSYNQALKIKPGDAFARGKLDLINEELYRDFLNEGDIALAAKQFNKAADAYNEALKIKPNDKVAGSKLVQIEKDKVQDRINDIYTSYIDAGDKAIGNKSYHEAKISYNEALKIRPGDSLATMKIKLVNQKIEADSLETVRLKTEATFKGFIDAANRAMNSKDYNGAIFSYTEALKIKPGDEYAMAQAIEAKQAIELAKTDSLNRLKDQAGVNNNKEIIDSLKAVKPTGTTDVRESAAREIETGMLLLKARYFKMGSDVGAFDEGPLHPVKFDSFYISRFEVTQSQWQSIMGNNPSFFKNCEDCPVENVSWDDVMKFIAQLNQISNKKYRLPTEAEWEYVAGTQNKKDNVADIAWYNDNAKNKTHHIGLLKPNFLEVYDMFGNVAEWCSDWYSSAGYGKKLSDNPAGPANGKEKVVRGGSWDDLEGAFRPSVRDKTAPGKANKKIGFRLVGDLN